MAGSSASAFQRSYNSFSGIDIKATFGTKVIGELQGISYSITREKAPIYTMGSADPRAYARGKRGIAGSLIFIMFDRHALLTELREELKFLSDKDDLRSEFIDPASFTSTTVSSSGLDAANPISGQEQAIAGVEDDQEVARPWYVDQIPPFDVSLGGANEYGALAVMKILGVEILNEGYGISIDDIVSEQQMTYVARQIIPWTPVDLSQEKKNLLGFSGP